MERFVRRWLVPFVGKRGRRPTVSLSQLVNALQTDLHVVYDHPCIPEPVLDVYRRVANGLTSQRFGAHRRGVRVWVSCPALEEAEWETTLCQLAFFQFCDRFVREDEEMTGTRDSDSGAAAPPTAAYLQILTKAPPFNDGTCGTSSTCASDDDDASSRSCAGDGPCASSASGPPSRAT